MHDLLSTAWAAWVASLSLAVAALSKFSAELANEAVSLAHESLSPLGGSYLPRDAASWAYSLVCVWIVSQDRVSDCVNSLPTPLLSPCIFFMDWPMGEGGPPPPPGIPPGPPDGPWLNWFFSLLHAAEARRKPKTTGSTTRRHHTLCMKLSLHRM